MAKPNSENRSEKKQDYNAIFKELGPYLNLGLQMLIPILGGALGGYWLDKKYETTPTWTVALALLGIAVGMYSFFKTIAEAEKRKKNKQIK